MASLVVGLAARPSHCDQGFAQHAHWPCHICRANRVSSTAIRRPSDSNRLSSDLETDSRNRGLF